MRFVYNTILNSLLLSPALYFKLLAGRKPSGRHCVFLFLGTPASWLCYASLAEVRFIRFLALLDLYASEALHGFKIPSAYYAGGYLFPSRLAQSLARASNGLGTSGRNARSTGYAAMTLS